MYDKTHFHVFDIAQYLVKASLIKITYKKHK